MKKRVFAAVLSLAMVFTVAGCSKQPEEGTVEAFVPTGEISAETVCVDVTANEDGYYSLFADVTVDFGDDGQIQTVSIEDTTLLAFQVSSRYPGGAYIYTGEDMKQLIERLESAVSTADDSETKDLIESVIEELEMGGPIEGAST